MEKSEVKIRTIKFIDGKVVINSNIHHPSGDYKLVETTLYTNSLSDVNSAFIDNIKSMASSIVVEMDNNKKQC